MSEAHRVIGWRCRVCAATLDIADPTPWRCPNSSAEDRHHLLERVETAAPAWRAATPSSLVAHDLDCAWSAGAAANGVGAEQRRALIDELDRSVAVVDGNHFAPTPLARSDALSDRLGFASGGGVWVKDETGAVAGSHKARHLAGILLHLRAAELAGHLPVRPRLAIASCGNAALAAATLARAAAWPLDVFVPTWMDETVGRQLDALDAQVHRCHRRDADPPGDPAMLRFREAVDDGAVPFTVQGPENALCLDTGRTLGWEINAQSVDVGGFGRAFVQVGGGALLSCFGAAMADGPAPPVIHAVQAAGCAPLARAWQRADSDGDVASRWDELMTVWDQPHSAADGILDDETYDWLGSFDAMRGTGGSPVVASEEQIVDAHRMFVAAGYPVSATGAAGLAGVLAARGRVGDHERVLVVASGVAR